MKTNTIEPRSKPAICIITRDLPCSGYPERDPAVWAPEDVRDAPDGVIPKTNLESLANWILAGISLEIGGPRSLA